jgi:hypothetical protein
MRVQHEHTREPAAAPATPTKGALAKPKAAMTEVFRIQPHPGAFAPGVTSTKFNRLADGLEDEAFLQRQRRAP